MTLSLEDVRSKRFRMARKSGYEVLEVDEFVDQVEATFEQLFEENQNLKKQVEALKSSAGTAAAAAPETDAAPAAQAAPATAPAPVPAAEPRERIVVTTSPEASTAVVRLVQLSTEQSEQLVAEAAAEAARIREEASATAEQVQTEARTTAEQLQADARQRAESLDRDTETRRAQLFGELEQQREQLSNTVHALRAFEATYRQNLTRHLQSQIEVLASGHEEPADPPPGITPPVAARTSEPQPAAERPAPAEDEADRQRPDQDGTSETPRLDALLGDQR